MSDQSRFCSSSDRTTVLFVRFAGQLPNGASDPQFYRVADGADLFICEAYVFEKSVKYHLSYANIAEHRSRLRCKRLVLTHMSADMLDRRGKVEAELAGDGLILTI